MMQLINGAPYLCHSAQSTQQTSILYTPQDGRTALYQASFNGHSQVVELLTNAGAVVDIQNEVVVCGLYNVLVCELCGCKGYCNSHITKGEGI